MTKAELDSIIESVKCDSGLAHYPGMTTVRKEALERLIATAESLQHELSVAHAFHDVAVRERDYERMQLSRCQRELDFLKAKRNELGGA